MQIYKVQTADPPAEFSIKKNENGYLLGRLVDNNTNFKLILVCYLKSGSSNIKTGIPLNCILLNSLPPEKNLCWIRHLSESP